MPSSPDAYAVAADLRITVSTLVRRLRTHRSPSDPTVPETSVLARLDRVGPSTSAELARCEQISPQSMGVTVAGLLERGLVNRTPDPSDGRRMVLTLSPAGAATLTDRRNQRTRALTDAIAAAGLTADEIATLAAALPLLDRLGQQL